VAGWEGSDEDFAVSLLMWRALVSPHEVRAASIRRPEACIGASGHTPRPQGDEESWFGVSKAGGIGPGETFDRRWWSWHFGHSLSSEVKLRSNLHPFPPPSPG
jgi:hypothetical protein